VADLDGVGAPGKRNKWGATVVVSVFDADGAPVPDATVSGTWSDGYVGAASCTTDASGSCSLASGPITRAQTVATFTVSNVSHAALAYQPADNADPDGDSDGTAITVLRP
jgi:serine protease AprX